MKKLKDIWQHFKADTPKIGLQIQQIAGAFTAIEFTLRLLHASQGFIYAVGIIFVILLLVFGKYQTADGLINQIKKMK